MDAIIRQVADFRLCGEAPLSESKGSAERSQVAETQGTMERCATHNWTIQCGDYSTVVNSARSCDMIDSRPIASPAPDSAADQRTLRTVALTRKESLDGVRASR